MTIGVYGRNPPLAVVSLAVEHRFTGPLYTVGIEEELMIIDSRTMGLVNRVEEMLEASPGQAAGEIKPELMESVLEIATRPCSKLGEASQQLKSLRRQVGKTAAEQGLLIGSAGTHPFSKWEEQRIVSRERYRDLVKSLRFIARQELLFGMHVHVGVDDPEKAIHVANGMRVHLPILLALSANSPFWRGLPTGILSTRTPIFRTFPRVGIPPRYENYADFCERVEFMVSSGVIDDYTYLWWDVRPHPNFGTVEIRVLDAQTRLEHTIALAALVLAMVKEICEHFDSGKELSRYPYELLDENKWLAARHGLEGELVDLPHSRRVSAVELARRLVKRLAPHAKELGCDRELEGIEDLIANGSGGQRQLRLWQKKQDLRELVREIVKTAAASPQTEEQ